MAHVQQKCFFSKVKKLYPDSFTDVTVIDCGSFDVNGSLKDLFTDSEYVGVDIVQGKNVDVVSAVKDLPDTKYDTVVSGEMLEHDETWRESLMKMYNITNRGGLIAISCAGEGRKEHGTIRTGNKQWSSNGEYYKNLNEVDFREVYKDDMFEVMKFEYNSIAFDTYFYGIKK